jgi:hypothetical protein
MRLTPEENHFLTDPESWQYGPTYDLTWRFQPGVPTEAVLERLLSLPGVKPWQLRDDERTLLIVQQPQLLAWPLGLLYYTWPRHPEHTSDIHHRLVLYPRQFEHICGTYPHFYLPEAFRRAETVGLHALLLWLVERLHRTWPVLGACLSDETYGAQLVPGHLLLLKDTVAYLGLYGKRPRDDQDEAWQLFPLEQLPALIATLGEASSASTSAEDDPPAR